MVLRTSVASGWIRSTLSISGATPTPSRAQPPSSPTPLTWRPLAICPTFTIRSARLASSAWMSESKKPLSLPLGQSMNFFRDDLMARRTCPNSVVTRSPLAVPTTESAILIRGQTKTCQRLNLTLGLAVFSKRYNRWNM